MMGYESGNEQDPMSPRNHDRYTVLVVDDDPSVLATYRRLLRRAGYVPLVSDDPRQVLDGCWDDAAPDLLLIDYKMPGMDGLTLLAELRRRECRARCILLSAFINDDVGKPGPYARCRSDPWEAGRRVCPAPHDRRTAAGRRQTAGRGRRIRSL